MAYAESRGLTADTVNKLSIGWNPEDRYESREAWGLPPEMKDNGQGRRVWLPAGLVIPCRRKSFMAAVKIRRTAWKDEDSLPKYVALSGSVLGLALGCDTEKPVVLVESELDAALVWQEAGDLVGALALGTASGKPDTDTTIFLRTAPRILVALDYDEAGLKAYPWWPQHFAQAKPWPTPEGKDVGDLANVPGYIRAWIEAAFLDNPKAVAWPSPESIPLDTSLPDGRYACLHAIATVYGAGLARSARGQLTLNCPTGVPQDAAEAMHRGLEELAGYINRRVC